MGSSRVLARAQTVQRGRIGCSLRWFTRPSWKCLKAPPRLPPQGKLEEAQETITWLDINGDMQVSAEEFAEVRERQAAGARAS